MLLLNWPERRERLVWSSVLLSGRKVFGAVFQTLCVWLLSGCRSTTNLSALLALNLNPADGEFL
jgi:hypothetical protein